MARARGIVRGALRAVRAWHDRYPGRICGRRAVRTAQGRERSARILPRGRHAAAIERLRYQDRSLAAGERLERQISGRGQRRLVGRDQLRGLAQALQRGLCRQFHRHRPLRRQRQLRAGPSGKADRLRLPLGARDDRRGEGDHRGFLRQRPAPFLLERMLGRRQAGLEGSAALSGRFRRHHRRRPGRQLDRPRGAVDLGGAGRAQR